MSIKRIVSTVYSLAFIASAVEGAEPGKTLLALGDSLATGQLPGFFFFTEEGWVNTLYSHLQENYAFDTLANAACPAETTANFMEANAANDTDCPATSGNPSLCYSGICDVDFFPKGLEGESQMDAAQQYLETNPGQVGLIVVSLGVNDLGECDQSELLTCAPGKMDEISDNLSFIVTSLQLAAQGVPVIGLLYHNPLVALYLSGGDSVLAIVSEQLLASLNLALAVAYGAVGAYTGDSFEAINGNDFSGDPRADVINVCDYTGMCAGMNGTYALTDPLEVADHQHPNQMGYELIGKSFIQVVEGENLLGNAPGTTTTGPTSTAGSISSVSVSLLVLAVAAIARNFLLV